MKKLMKRERLLAAFEKIDEKFIAEAAPGNKLPKNHRNRWGKWISIAACVCFVVGIGIDTIDRFEYLKAGCGAAIGKFVDGTYYYHVKSDGLYSYTPEEGNQKVLSTYWYEDCDINTYGVYYDDGRSLYVQEHATSKRRLLYRAGYLESTHINFSLERDGNIIVSVYNRCKDTIYEVRLDGQTGEVLETVTEKQDIIYGGDYYSDVHFSIGERELIRLELENGYDLLENGASILPKGIKVGRYDGTYIEDNLWFYVNDGGELTGEKQKMLVIRPDGTDEFKVLPIYERYSGNNEYLFFSRSEQDEMWCFDVEMNESWQLEVSDDFTLYSIASDGEHVFSCAPWDDAQILWKLVYDEEGRPIRMELVDENIRE